MDLVQNSFRDRTLSNEYTWETFFILSKGGGDYRGIGIIKVLCETLPLLINHRIYMSVMYHKALHRFRLVRDMVTASLEYNMLHQLTEMGEEFLYKVFLYLKNSYYALAQERCMEIIM